MARNKDVKVVYNTNAFLSIRNNEALDDAERRANKIKAAADNMYGREHKVVTFKATPGHSRSAAVVFTEGPHSTYSNAVHNTLLKALNKAR